jgi:integrase
MIEGKIAQANGRLKSANVGVVIQAVGNRLYLRATLPPRPGSSRDRPYQSTLSTEKEARKIGALLDCREFRWEVYLPPSVNQAGTTGYWFSKFEAEVKPIVADVTWKTEYQEVLARLESDQPLTVELLRAAIERTEPNTRTRRRYCTTLSRFAVFAGLEADFKLLQSNYSAKQVDPRSLPTDEAIAAGFYKITNPSWQWAYGMMATFGLRNHEVFYLDTQDLEQGRYWVTVKEGKTGRQLVWACYLEWVDQFDLRQPKIPDVTGKKHADYGERVSQYFRRTGFSFTAYDLRHRWAVRTLEFGLDISLAAQQMGHSVRFTAIPITTGSRLMFISGHLRR